MSISADADCLSNPTRIFRLRLYYLVSGIVCGVFLAIIGIGSVLVALWNIDGSFSRPREAALLFGVVYSGFTLLAAFMVAAYFRERLEFSPTTIVQRGIFRTRTLSLSEIVQIKWHIWPGQGSFVVRTASQKVTIYLDNFTTEECLEIVQFLRHIPLTDKASL